MTLPHLAFAAVGRYRGRFLKASWVESFDRLSMRRSQSAELRDSGARLPCTVIVSPYTGPALSNQGFQLKANAEAAASWDDPRYSILHTPQLHSQSRVSGQISSLSDG